MKHLNYLKWYYLISLGIISTIIVSSCTKDEFNNENEFSQYEALLSKSISDYEIVSIDYNKYFEMARKIPSNYIEVDLELDQHPDWKFKMKGDDLKKYFADDFKFIVIGENESETEQQLPEMYAMEGYFQTPEQQVLLTFSLGRLEGLINVGDKEYSIEPLFNYDQNAPNNLYVIYEVENLLIDNMPCLDDVSFQNPKDDNSTLNHNGTKTWKVYITYLGDYQFYQKFYNTTNAGNYMYWRFYYANKRYHAYNNVNVEWKLRTGYLYSWYGSRNYYPRTTSNSATFVRECSKYYYYNWYNEGDANYFFTGDNVAGVHGRADGIRTMCHQKNRAFSFGEYNSSTYFAQNLMAHEVGHTIGMYHDQSSNNYMHKWSNYWNTTLGINARANLNYSLSINTCLSYW